MVRPFRKLSEVGSPIAGSVSYGLLEPNKQDPLRVLYSISQGRSAGRGWTGGRLLIFPGWGNGNVSEYATGIEAPVDHITIEDTPAGNVSVHLTTPHAWQGPKPRPFEATALGLRNETDLHIGTLAVRRPGALDGAGEVSVAAGQGLTRDARRTASQLNNVFRDVWHVVHQIPEETPWTEENHLQVNFIITKRSLEDRTYPTFALRGEQFVEDESIPENYLFRYDAYPLTSSTWLVAAFSVRPGRLRRDFNWLVRRLHQRPPATPPAEA